MVASVVGITEAVARLNVLGLPFVSFSDARHCRGGVLCRRWDGHYGFLTADRWSR